MASKMTVDFQKKPHFLHHPGLLLLRSKAEELRDEIDQMESDDRMVRQVLNDINILITVHGLTDSFDPIKASVCVNNSGGKPVVVGKPMVKYKGGGGGGGGGDRLQMKWGLPSHPQIDQVIIISSILSYAVISFLKLFSKIGHFEARLFFKKRHKVPLNGPTTNN